MKTEKARAKARAFSAATGYGRPNVVVTINRASTQFCPVAFASTAATAAPMHTVALGQRRQLVDVGNPDRQAAELSRPLPHLGLEEQGNARVGKRLVQSDDAVAARCSRSSRTKTNGANARAARKQIRKQNAHSAAVKWARKAAEKWIEPGPVELARRDAHLRFDNTARTSQ
jgi:hypothetical protein